MFLSISNPMSIKEELFTHDPNAINYELEELIEKTKQKYGLNTQAK